MIDEFNVDNITLIVESSAIVQANDERFDDC